MLPTSTGLSTIIWLFKTVHSSSKTTITVLNHLLTQSYLLVQRLCDFVLCLISAPCTEAESLKCSRDKSDVQTFGNSNALCDGLGEEIEDGWFDAFVPRERALESEEDDVGGESVNKSCEKKFHNSGNNKSSHFSIVYKKKEC